MTGRRYDVQLSASAARTFRKFDQPVQKRLSLVIDKLAVNPRPPGIRRLHGDPDLYRIRVGNYRIVYTIRDNVLLVLVVAIGHRKDIYR